MLRLNRLGLTPKRKWRGSISATLTYGRKNPATGDPGSTWFQNLNDNIVLDDAHDHDGVDSVRLTSVALTKFTSTIAAADWASAGGGNYTKVVTVPSGISAAASPHNEINYYSIICMINTAGSTFGDRIYPGIERESSTTFTVIVNDNTLDILIYYI